MGKEVEEVKPKSKAQEAADKTVDETKKQLETRPGGDTHGAYNKLAESVRQTHQELDKSDKTGKTSKEYEEAVVKKLQDEKLLPVLALEYGQRAFEKIDHKSADTGMGNGQLTKEELKAFKEAGRPGVFGKAMVDSLIDQSDSLKANGNDKGVQSEGISQVDLANGVIKHENTREAKINNEKKAEEVKVEQGEAKQLQNYLFEGKDGKPSIFAQADFAGSSDSKKRSDGLVGKHDFEALASDPRLSEQEKKDLKEKVLDKWDDPKFQSRYLENGYMSADTFKKATGEEQAATEQEAQKQAEAMAKEAETRKKEEAEQSAKTKAEANGLQELLNKKVGNANVHAAADYAGSDNKDARSDKLVNKNDLKALLSSPDLDQALAKQIKETIVDKMDSADFKKKYMNGDYLDLEKIKKATGIEDALEAEDRKWEDIAKVGKETKEIEQSDAKARQIALEREQAVKLATELVRDEGHGSLHARADFVGSSNATNRTDKLVGRNDLEALVTDPSLSEEKRKFIQDNFLGDKWNSPAVKRMRQGDYISPESLKALLPNS